MSRTHRGMILAGLLVPTMGLTSAWATDGGRFRATAANSITDPAGDTLDGDDQPVAAPRGDVVGASGESGGGNHVFRYSAADTVDPLADPNWSSGDTFADFMLDTNGDGAEDYDVEYGVSEGALYVEVYPVTEAESAPVLCTGTGTFEAGQYTATVPASCIGSPAAVGYRVETVYDTNPGDDNAPIAYDLAPDSGFAGPV